MRSRIIRRPLITEKADAAEGSVEHGLLRGRHAAPTRSRFAAPSRSSSGSRCVDVRVANRARQDEAHGPVRRPAHGLEKGLRPARAGPEDRVLRGRVMAASRSSNRPPPGVRFQTTLDFEELSHGPPGEAPDGRTAHDRRPQQPGPDDLPLHGRRPQAALPRSSTSGATSRTSRRRSPRSSTTRTARRGSRCCTTPTARSATSSRPTASRSAPRWCRARRPTSCRATRCR